MILTKDSVSTRCSGFRATAKMVKTRPPSMPMMRFSHPMMLSTAKY